MSDWKNVQYKDGKLRTGEGGGGGGSSTFAGLDDVDFSNLQDGQVAKYDAQNEKWVNADESGGGGTVTDVEVNGVSVVNQQGVAEIIMPTPPSVPDKLSDLSDVQFSNLTDHQPLRYNATSQKWVNGADSFPPLIYSDEEREIGVWRDGKPLYQKTLTTTQSLALTQNTWVKTEFDKGSLDKIINLSIVDGNGAYNSEISAGFIDNKVAINCARAVSYTMGINIILQYTKTTDTAGSGQWTTGGIPTHHYSTSEKVIGTWIDGKPLYEKTVVFETSVTSQSADLDTGLRNIDNIFICPEASYLDISRKLPVPRVHSDTSYNAGVGVTVNNGSANLNIRKGSNAGSCTPLVTFRYTKTTD